MKTQEQLVYERGLPCNLEAERVILGSILLNDACFVQVVGLLQLDDFSLEKHRRIFARMCDLDKRGDKIDRITVYAELEKQGQVESVDGLGYLLELDSMIPEIANLESYTRIVKDKSTLRKIIFAMQRVVNRCLLAEDEPDEIIVDAEESLTHLGAQVSAEDGIVSTRDLIEKYGLDNLLGPRMHGSIRLPMQRLDEAIGGLHGGQMIVLMARTSRGKSSLAYQIATSAALQDAPPVVWSLEVNAKEIFKCLTQQLSGVWPDKYALSFEERKELNMAGCKLNEHWIYTDERARNVAEFVARLRRVRHKSKLGLAIVDHLQLIRGHSKFRAQEVSDNSRALKLAAMDLDIPIIVLSQVDRASVKGDGKIGLHSAKESGDIENDADVVMWIDSEEEFSWKHPTLASIHIGKNRNGMAGLKVPLLFQPAFRAFWEVAE